MTDHDARTERRTPDDLSLQTHRRIIGTLGLILPAFIYLMAGGRPTPGVPRWELLGSVSAYYYTGAVGVFVGVLFALSLFLFSYRGYKGVRADRIVGTIGGAAAMLVALFPTGAPPGLAAPAWWTEPTRIIHYVGAVTLFGAFILFSVWLFRRSDTPLRRDRPPDKCFRDDVCLACGVVMIACVLWAGSSLFTGAAIFAPEAIAVIAFAVSWLVKGEAHEPVIRATRRLMKRTSVFLVVVALATGSMACGSSGGGGGNNDGGAPLGSGAITWKDNGTTQVASLSTANRVVNASIDLLQIVGSNSDGVGIAFGAGMPPPLVAGSYTCADTTGGRIVSLAYTVGSASSGVPTCTIDIPTLGGATGERVKGTFSAMLTLDNGMAKTITDGVFDLPVMVINQ